MGLSQVKPAVGPPGQVSACKRLPRTLIVRPPTQNEIIDLLETHRNLTTWDYQMRERQKRICVDTLEMVRSSVRVIRPDAVSSTE